MVGAADNVGKDAADDGRRSHPGNASQVCMYRLVRNGFLLSSSSSVCFFSVLSKTVVTDDGRTGRTLGFGAVVVL